MFVKNKSAYLNEHVQFLIHYKTPSVNTNSAPPNLIHPQQHRLAGSPQQRINLFEIIVRNGRTAPAFRRTVGVIGFIGHTLPRMQYDGAFEGIAVARFESVQHILGMHPPLTIRPFTNFIFAQRGAVTPIFVAKRGTIFTQRHIPKNTATAMAHRKTMQYFSFFKRVHHKSVTPGMLLHI